MKKNQIYVISGIAVALAAAVIMCKKKKKSDTISVTDEEAVLETPVSTIAVGEPSGILPIKTPIKQNLVAQASLAPSTKQLLLSNLSQN